MILNNAATHRNDSLIRVSHQHPCPVCDKPDWCSVSADGHIAICMRIEEGSVKESKNGGYVHSLKANRHRHHSQPTFVPSKDPPQRASPQTLNRVYRDLHAELSLNTSHRVHLIEDRGLTPEEIRKLDYRTMPDIEALPERRRILGGLVEKHDRTLLTVPGFYLTQRGRIWLAGTGGLLIPCKDVDGNIVGWQIRIDGKQGSGKYRWLSATEKQRKHGGVSSGTPLHVAGREHESKRVWITEGIIKADIAALRLNETVIGIAGVSSWNRNELQQTLEKLDVESVVIAFDADMKQNRHVKRSLRRLAQAVMSMGYRVLWARWNLEQGKGIDDLLTNEHKPTLEPYRPPVNLDNLKTIGGEKRVRRNSLPNRIKPAEPCDIDDLRQRMHNEIRDFAQNADGGALLVKGTQGLSKSTGSIEIVHDLWQNQQLRPVYSGPRHALLDALLDTLNLDGWLHVQPRKPRDETALELSPERANLYVKGMMAGTDAFDPSDLTVLCPHWKRANAIADKRWNVVKDICLTDCEIGIGGCPYFMQYRSEKPLATVHETLFIPRFCDDIFGERQFQLHHAPRQVCIIDEPNPSKFYETVNITPDDLSRAIVDAWDKNLKALLSLVRETAESVASRLTSRGDQSQEGLIHLLKSNGTQRGSIPRRIDPSAVKRKIIGHQVMQELVDFAGGEDKLEKRLSDAKAEAPSKHEKVIVGIDAFLDETKKSWKVIINNEVRFLPKVLADPIDNESIEVVRGYALAENFPILSHFVLNEDGDVPLNFCTDLLSALNREFQLYQKGVAYNSALVFTVKGKTPIVRLNLRKEIFVPQEVPLILLDAQGNADLLSRLLRRKVETWLASISSDTEITQIVDGTFGITSLWNSKKNEPKSSLRRLLNKVVLPIVKRAPKDTLIVTWRKVADYLRKLQDEGNLSRAVGIEHYGNIEGSNEHEHRRTVILLGTPQVSPDELEEMAHALFQNDETPISMETEQQWEGYNYRDCNGKGYEVKTRRYLDERVELLSRLFKEDEIVQAAHRVRPLLHQGREVYLLTNQPIEELPPTRLTTIDELSTSLGTEITVVDEHGKMTREFFNDFAIQFEAEHDDRISAKSLKPALQQTFVKMAIKDSYGEVDERLSPQGFPSDSTLERWLKDLAQREGWDRSRVTVEHRDPDRGGGATWVCVYHEGELDEEAVRAEYAELLEARDGDVVIVESFPWAEDEGVIRFDNFGREKNPPQAYQRE